MKYLSDYMEERQTELFKKTGTIFAFSKEQFEEGKKESIKQDIKENGKKKIILRELQNHEAFYVGNIEDTIHKLEDYPITEDEISHIFSKNWAKYSDQ